MKNVKKNAFIKKVCMISALLLEFTLCVYSQETSEETKEESDDVLVLTVDDAVQFATENSRILKAADLDLALAKWNRNTAWNTFLPDLSINGTLSRSNKYTNTSAGMAPLYSALGQITGNPALTAAGNSMSEDETESKHWKAIGGVNVSWAFNAAMIQSMRNTMLEYETGKITWEQSVKQNELNIRKLFYGILLFQENVRLQEISLENARERMNQAAVNFRNGYVPELSYLQTQVNYENLRPTVEQARQALFEQIGTFAILIGLPEGTRIKLAGEIKAEFIDVNKKELLTMFEDSNLDIASVKQTLKSLKLQKSALDLSSYTPSLQLSWGWQPVSIGSGGAFDMDWGNKDNWLDNGSFAVTFAWNITNMIPGSANRNNAKKLSENIAKLELNLETLIQNTALEISTAVDKLEQARKAIDSSERNIQLAQRSYDMTVTAYRNGTKELLDVRDAENQLNQAKLSLASSSNDYISAVLDLEYKLNIKLTNQKINKEEK